MVIELCASLSSPLPPAPSSSSSSRSSRFNFSSCSSTSSSHSLPSTSPPDACSDFSAMFDYFLSPSTTNSPSSTTTTTATLSSAASPHYRFNTFVAEMEADDRVGSDGFLSQNPLLCTSSPNATFGSSSATAEVERKRAMLNLSISKIQTINTSHAPISLRKSVLIYNTMKCLQRELSESSERDDVLGSLMEADDAVSATTNSTSSSETMDVANVGEFGDFKDIEVISELNEPMTQDEETAVTGDGEHQWTRDAKKTVETPSAEVVDSEEDMDISTSPQQHLFYDDLFCSSGWSPNRFDSSWNYLSSYSNESSYFGSSGLNISSSVNSSSNTSNSSNFFSSGSFIEDYLSVWGGFENESDSLSHHNLSQVDIMHMFGSPRSPHQHQLNNELISQA